MQNRVKPHLVDDRFIAVNILPARIKRAKNLATLKRQILVAQAYGFKHVWVNPIADIPSNSVCNRICLDTGIHTDLYQSLYAPNNPMNIRSDFSHDELRAMNQDAKDNGVLVLVDFVWKHISEHSSILKNHPTWKGKKIKDIVEYDFESNTCENIENCDETKTITVFEAIIQHLKAVIDHYLDAQDGLGFAGLRIDAASHFTPNVREALISYIQYKYPLAIVFEEVLFDRNQEVIIRSLVKDAEEKNIYSNFTTSNLYYQKPDAYGALPHPENMGDSEKLKLSHNHGISFTGNHDHYSVGWSVVLSMAAKRIMDDKSFLAIIDGISSSPLKNDNPSIDNLSNILSKIVYNNVYVECMDPAHIEWVRYLVPYANEIAREILQLNEKVLNEFKTQLFERISNRTLASISGYFFLFSEMISPFETQRIFTNKDGEPLQQLLLTIEDLASQPDITMGIIKKMASDEKYNNIKNFMKIPATKLPLSGDSNKAKSSKMFRKHSNIKENVIDLGEYKNQLRIWLPYIIEYLRNNPRDNGYIFYQDKENMNKLNNRLCQYMDLKRFIRGINDIYANFTTPHCTDYHTFTSLDKYKIIVRSSNDSTDITILNLKSKKMMHIDDIEIRKIAVWFQARKYPIAEACPNNQCVLQSPFNGQSGISYAPDEYSYYWRKKVGDAFDDSFNRIVGNKPNHRTNLYLGYGLTINLNEFTSINLKIHLKTDRQLDNEVFHDKKDEPFHIVAASMAENIGEITIGLRIK